MSNVSVEQRLAQMGRDLRRELADGKELSGSFFRRMGKLFVEELLSAEVAEALGRDKGERRDRAAACPAGYRDAACEACRCALYVPVGQGGDVLCPQCRRDGEALAADDAADDHGGGPRPPAAGAMHPDYPQFAALAAHLLDDQLCEAIGVADVEPARFKLHNTGQREAFLDALSAEVVRRLEGRRAA